MTLSDNHTYNQCLENTRKTCRLNCLPSIPVLGLTWGMFQPELLKMGRVDIILASDCFYDTKDFEDVIVTVSFLLKRNPGSEFWCTYQERSSNRSIEHLLSKWQLQCLHVPLSTFDADSPNIAGSHLPGNHTIHMLVVSTTGTDCDRLWMWHSTMWLWPRPLLLITVALFAGQCVVVKWNKSDLGSSQKIGRRFPLNKWYQMW